LVLGAVAGVFNWKQAPLIAAIIAFIASFFIWLSFGIHFPITVAVEDVCVQANLVKEGKSSFGALNEIINCNNGSQFAEVRQKAENGINEAFSTACQAIEQLCNNSQVSCSTKNCSKNNIVDYETSIVTDFMRGCIGGGNNVTCPDESCGSNWVPCHFVNRTLSDCAQNCYEAQLRNLSYTFVHNVDQLMQYESLYNNDILPLLTCSFIDDFVNEVYSGLCVNLVDGIETITLVSGLIGLFLIPGTILLLMGYKRFRSNSGKEEDELEKMELPTLYNPKNLK